MTVIMGRCDWCKLMFCPKPKDEGTPGCQCLDHECGCWILREQTEKKK